MEGGGGGAGINGPISLLTSQFNQPASQPTPEASANGKRNSMHISFIILAYFVLSTIHLQITD